MKTKIDNKNKFNFAKQTVKESLSVRQERYLDAISDESVDEFDSNLKKILITLDKKTHHQLSVVHKYLKKKQNNYVVELIKEDLKKNFPSAWSSLYKEINN